LAQPAALGRGPGTRLLVAGLLLGALIRAVLLPVPGSPDVGSWKVWTFEGAADATGLYGVGGSPPERRRLAWNGIEGTTEYPPLGLYQLALVGRAYFRIDSAYRDSSLLTALVKTPGLAAEALLVVALLTIGGRLFGAGLARWAALAIWLNPAVIVNGAALGYLDAQMAVPAALALLAALFGWPVVAGALIAAAILTKAQAVFVLPVIAFAVLFRDRARAIAALTSLCIGGLAMTTVIVLPIALRGALPNMLNAMSRLAAHDMLSGNAMNAWWIVTWIVRAIAAAPELGAFTAWTMPVKILQNSRFMEVGYPDAKSIGTALVLAAVAWGLWRTRRGAAPAAWALVGGWTVFAYAMLGAQVHENHLYLAVPMFLLAAALAPEYRGVFWAVSWTTALNMYFFYGLGDGRPPLGGRSWTGIDVTVVGAFVNLALLGWVTRKVAAATAGRLPLTQPPRSPA